jgi:hypothetical protein
MIFRHVTMSVSVNSCNRSVDRCILAVNPFTSCRNAASGDFRPQQGLQRGVAMNRKSMLDAAISRHALVNRAMEHQACHGLSLGPVNRLAELGRRPVRAP